MNYQLNPNIVVRNIADRCVAIPIGPEVDAVKSIYNLNETANKILSCIKENLDLESTEKHLSDIYETPEGSSFKEEILKTCEELKKNGILL